MVAGSRNLGAWSCRPCALNTAEGESGLSRISRERDGGAIEGSHRRIPCVAGSHDPFTMTKG